MTNMAFLWLGENLCPNVCLTARGPLHQNHIYTDLLFRAVLRAIWEAVSWATSQILPQINFNSELPHCAFSQLTLWGLQSEVMSPLSSSPIMFCLPHSIWKTTKKQKQTKNPPIFPPSHPNKGRQHEQKNPVVLKWLYCDILESKVVGGET